MREFAQKYRTVKISIRSRCLFSVPRCFIPATVRGPSWIFFLKIGWPSPMQNTFSCPIISAISFQRGPLEEGLLHTRCAEPIGKLSEFARTFMPEGSGAGDAIPYPTSSDGGSANISLQQKRKQRIMSAFTLRVLAAASVPDTALCRISYGRMAHSPSEKLHVLLSMRQFMPAKSNHRCLSSPCYLPI